jgi:hypothetical protein
MTRIPLNPIWECDFHHLSYGFRPARSVHHAIRTVKLLRTESDEDKAAGRWGHAEADLRQRIPAASEKGWRVMRIPVSSPGCKRW